MKDPQETVLLIKSVIMDSRLSWIKSSNPWSRLVLCSRIRFSFNFHILRTQTSFEASKSEDAKILYPIYIAYLIFIISGFFR